MCKQYGGTKDRYNTHGHPFDTVGAKTIVCNQSQKKTHQLMSSFYFVSFINEQSFCNCLAFKSFFQLLKKKIKKLICDEQDYVIV